MLKRLASITGAVLLVAIAATLTAKRTPLLPRRQTTMQADESNRRRQIIANDMAAYKRLHEDLQAQLESRTNAAKIAKVKQAATSELNEAKRRSLIMAQEKAAEASEMMARRRLIAAQELAMMQRTHTMPLDNSITRTELYSHGYLICGQNCRDFGMSGCARGSVGYVRATDATWKIRGTASVYALDAAGTQIGKFVPTLVVGAAGDDPNDPTPKVPRIEIIVQGKSHWEYGFGRHKIEDADGKLLMSIDVQPFVGR